MQNIREEAKSLIDAIPEPVTWDAILYQLYVKKKVEEGLAALKQGMIFSHEEIKQRFIKHEN
ncbi:hypothetical protein [Moorella sp. Hama-1]|uniref:hypothetical protein n=1 Tax=Moorella sp. Hama-1 TaxID=2138101 RepID=UPI000D65E672|nr:hypothetical protein [Moorella sp. Hama-1]BCV21716.1 hypothetical protein hamaS1_17850 [Moorella sp. Hama-1]